MEELTTDHPLSHGIVLSFLDFLKSVKPAPGIDTEGLEVAKECLMEVFKLNSSSVDKWNFPGLLVNIFQSPEINHLQDIQSDVSQEAVPSDVSGPSQTLIDVNYSQGMESRETRTSEACKDDLLQQFFSCLEKLNFFESTLGANEVECRLDKTALIFKKALLEIESSECPKFDKNTLADVLKLQGNKAMQSKLYPDAIDLYSFAIALCEDNAVYYCNRGAAYTQIQRYDDAIRDCEKAIEIDPSYIKAYSRLGTAYYAQGKYTDALQKGFKKALQLDPSNEANRVNWRVGEVKRLEELMQNMTSARDGNQEATSSSTPPPPPGEQPFDLTQMVTEAISNALQGAPLPPGADNREGSGDTNFEVPEIRIEGNVSFRVGDQISQPINVPLQSIMDMFTDSASASGDTHENSNERPAG